MPIPARTLHHPCVRRAGASPRRRSLRRGVYAEIAPDAPHRLHMPSHTFSPLGSLAESFDSNVAAASAARREGQTAEELHSATTNLRLLANWAGRAGVRM